jgi:hypothetical protein
MDFERTSIDFCVERGRGRGRDAESERVNELEKRR